MKQELKSLALGLFLSGAILSTANAAIITTDIAGNAGLTASYTSLGGGLSTFDDPGLVPTPPGTPSNSTPFVSGGLNWPANTPVGSGAGAITIGSADGITATPYHDDTNYLSVIANPSIGPAILSLAVQASQLGLYWGSIDTYNSIQFYLNNVLVDTFSGATLTPANGCQTDDACNRYIVLSGIVGGVFDQVHFLTNGQNSFEFDNVSVNAVPIPGAAVLFFSGLAGLGYLGRRRARTRNAVTA